MPTRKARDNLFTVGSLVDFNGGPFPSTENRYVCPGIVVNDETRQPSGRKLITVMWADGRVTSEWPVYLTHVIDDSDEEMT